MKAYKSTALLLFFAAAAGLTVALWFSQSTFQVAGATIEAKVFPSKQGLTRISVPPLGEIKAFTHVVPVAVGVSIERISLEQLKRVASSDISQAELAKAIDVDLKAAGRKFAVRLLILATLGGLAGALALPGRNLKRALTGALVGLVVIALPGFLTVRNYDVKAWRQPKYTGMLATAPWLLGTLEEKLGDLDAFRAEMRILARNLHDFYSKVEGWAPVKLGDGTLKVLHVGDIHNNPAAFDVVAQVVRDFQVDMIIDTGDLTDLGTPIEASIVSRVGSLGVPYLFVPGNHDSDAVLSALREQPNVVVADNNVVDVKGLKIFSADESSAHQFTAVPAKGVRLDNLAAEAASRYSDLDVPPDIVAIHNPKQAQGLIGRAPVILTGHTHQPELTVRKGTVVDNVGTTGAAGLRTFEVKDGLPYSLKLLYFAKRSKKLLAVDSLALSGETRDFMLERRLLVDNKDRLPNPSGSASLDLSWRPN